MFTKRNIAKILLLLFAVSFFITTMSGCGVILPDAGSSMIKKETHTKSGGGEGTHCVIFGADHATTNARGKTEYPLFVVDSQQRTRAEISSQPKVIPLLFLHEIGHYIVAALGGDVTDDYTGCSVSGTANLGPAEALNTALTIGQGLGSTIGGAASGVAMGVLVVIWCMNFITDIVNERFTMESLLKSCCKLIIGALVISYATPLVEAFMGLFSASTGSNPGTGFANSLGAAMSVPVSVFGGGVNLPVFEIGAPLALVWIDLHPVIALIGIIPLIAQVKCAVNIFTAMIVTGVELSLRATLAPLILAMSAHTGWGPHVLQYLKQSMGCALQPALVGGLITAAIGIPGTLGLTGGLLIEAIGLAVAYMIIGGLVTEVKSVANHIFH